MCYCLTCNRNMDIIEVLKIVQSNERLGCAAGVLADVELLWRNCRAYNAVDSVVYQDSLAAELLLATAWAKNSLPGLDGPSSSGGPQQTRTRATEAPEVRT